MGAVAGGIKAGRFEFGRNWRAFLSTLDETQILEAERSLITMLGRESLEGRTFLDAGSGSGLFSLAARRLGAQVQSFDVDPASAACTAELKSRFFPGDKEWAVGEGSVLDRGFLESLGTFDVVYSWGVLHHTGDLRGAMENILLCVAPGGQLFIAVYNDQGWLSGFWSAVKRTYSSGRLGRWAVSALFIPLLALQSAAAGLARHGNPLGHWKNYRQRRGMSLYHDWIDWLGGYPFEVAKPEEVARFYRESGCELTNLVTTRRHGCNQFVFLRA